MAPVLHVVPGLGWGSQSLERALSARKWESIPFPPPPAPSWAVMSSPGTEQPPHCQNPDSGTAGVVSWGWTMGSFLPHLLAGLEQLLGMARESQMVPEADQERPWEGGKWRFLFHEPQERSASCLCSEQAKPSAPGSACLPLCLMPLIYSKRSLFPC